MPIIARARRASIRKLRPNVARSSLHCREEGDGRFVEDDVEIWDTCFMLTFATLDGKM